MNQSSIPIIVGVTGHHCVDASCEEKIYAAVKQTLSHIQTAYPHSPVRMLTRLTEGTELLCARAARELNMELLVVLPMEKDDCRKELSAEAAEAFDRVCASAASVFVAPPTEATPQNPDRDFFYRQADVYIACHSHLLLALWDGNSALKDGCHTSQTVDFALNGTYQPEKGIALRSETNEAVVHIFTPRTAAQAAKAGEIAVLGDQDYVSAILKKTEAFNARASQLPMKHAAPEPNTTMADQTERLYSIADTLSSLAAARYKRTLGISAICSALFALSFLLYDEASITWMVLMCGLMLIGLACCLFFAKKSDCHLQYVEYRVLAEYLRVQSYLLRTGSSLRVVSLMPWSQQCENTWIMVAMCALMIGSSPSKQTAIRDSWVQQQHLYHQSAISSTGKKVARNNRIVSTAMVFSVVLYVAALLYESLFGNLFFVSTAIAPDLGDIIRNSIKIFLGLFSVGTMFIANYYGKIALDRRLTDHEKMEKFFKRLYDSISLHGQTEEILEYLAREELIENGNWYSYQINNKLDLSI